MNWTFPTALTLAALLLILFPSPVSAWGNGYSIIGATTYTNWSFMWNMERMYGTHDYLA